MTSRIVIALLLTMATSVSYGQTEPPESLTGETLKTWLKDNWYTGKFSDQGYNGARSAMYGSIDERSDGRVYCVYSGFSQEAESTTFLDPINAEHVVPQSFFGSASPMRSDIMHLFPTHSSVNSARSSNPFEEIPDAQTDTWYVVSGSSLSQSSSIPQSNIELYSEKTSSAFEPREDFKGDLARAVFYFFTVYDVSGLDISSVADINLLYQWHQDDPVDTWEETRNDRIEGTQGNRNPYVDYPELVCRAWQSECSNDGGGGSGGSSSSDSPILISAVFDATLSGGVPKGIELAVLEDIADLSLYAVGSANNGQGTDGPEFTLSGSASAGDFIYVTSDNVPFNTWFGFDATFDADQAMGINGDDAVELFYDATGAFTGSESVIDVYGDINTNGDGEVWDYTDGWAYRVSNTEPDGDTFTASNWTFSGLGALSIATSNATAANPIPIGTFTFASSPPTQVAFSSSEGTVAEDGGTFDLVISILNESATTATNIDLTLTSGDGGDLGQFSSQTITFPAGSSADQTVSITITDNALTEGDQQFEFTLSNPSGGESASIGSISQFTLTVEDDDPISCSSPDFFYTPVTFNSQQDNWSESTPGTYEANGFTGSSNDSSDLWLIHGPLDMSSTATLLLQFDISEGFEGGADSQLEVFYSSSYSGDPANAGNSWTSAGTFLSTGDDDLAGATADLSAAAGTDVFIGIQYTSDGESGSASSVILSNIEFLADVCPSSGIINWTGATDSSWNDGSNWDGGVPSAANYVMIGVSDNDPVIDGLGEVQELKIIANELLTVTSGASLIMKGGFSGGGKTNIMRNTTFSETDGQYSIIGSPIKEGTTDDLGNIVYGYFETVDYGDDGSIRFAEITTSQNMNPGDAFFSANTGDLTFTGTPNTGDISQSLIYDKAGDGSAANAGYNLVSNPYTAAIDVDLLVSGNATDISASIYLWKDVNSAVAQGTNADYEVYNSALNESTRNTAGGKSFDGYLRSAQGFFVKAISGATSLDFTPDMMSLGNNDDAGFYRTEKKTGDIARISISNGNTYSDALIAVRDDATIGIDKLYDAYKAGSTDLGIYSYIGEDRFAIQGLPPLQPEVNIALGFDHADGGTTTIKLEEESFDGYNFYLLDTELETLIDLANEELYTFETGAAKDSKRFQLLLRSSSVLSADDFDTQKFSIFRDKSGLNVATKDSFERANISIYTINGARIFEAKDVNFSRRSWNTPFYEEGIFILKIETPEGILTRKFLY